MSSNFSSSINLLSDDELAKRTGIARQTYRNWRQIGIGPKYLKINRAVRYRLEDVEEWLKSKEIIPVHERNKLTMEEIEKELKRN